MFVHAWAIMLEKFFIWDLMTVSKEIRKRINHLAGLPGLGCHHSSLCRWEENDCSLLLAEIIHLAPGARAPFTNPPQPSSGHPGMFVSVSGGVEMELCRKR